MRICLDMRTGAGCGTENPNYTHLCSKCGKALRFALMLHDAKTVVGRYRVVRVIGYGAYGAVYEATKRNQSQTSPLTRFFSRYLLGKTEPDEAVGRVALKETFDASSISSFAREFSVLSGLDHVNLPRYLHMFEADGNGYLVMEYVPGQSLQEMLDSSNDPSTGSGHRFSRLGPGTTKLGSESGVVTTESQVLGYALQLCDVLEYLHSQQPPILHRDIKPANIRLTPEGRIKLVDFGLLKQGGHQTRATIRGLGTPAYAPLEQYGDSQQATNARSDIYSLGATLYHLLSGQEPLSAPNRLGGESLPPLPSTLSSHVRDAVMKAMSLLPQDRFANMDEFRQALAFGSPESSLATGRIERKNVVRPQTAPQIQKAEPQNAEPASVPIERASLPIIETPVPPPIAGQETKEDQQEQWASVPITPLSRPTALPEVEMGVKWRFLQKQAPRIIEAGKKGLPHIVHKVNGEVLNLAFMDGASGRILICMTNKGIVYQWAFPGGYLKEVLCLAVRDKLQAIAYSPNGQTVATASDDTCVRIWRTLDGHLLHTLRGHADGVKTLIYTPDGQIVASAGGQDETVRLWGVKRGHLLRLFDAEQPIINLACDPNGDYLLASNENLSIILQIADGKLFKEIKQGSNRYSALAWSPSGKMVLYGKDDQTILSHLSYKNHIGLYKHDSQEVTSVAWRFDEQRFATGTTHNTVSIWSPTQSEALYHCSGHSQGVLSVAYSPSGQMIASGGKDQTMRLWYMSKQEAENDLETMLSHREDTIKLIERPIDPEREGTAGSGTAAYATSPIPYVEAVNEMGLPHLVCRSNIQIYTLAYSLDGQHLFGMSKGGSRLTWRVVDGQLVERLVVESPPLNQVAISPDTQTMAGVGDDLILRIWDLASGALRHSLRGHTGQIHSISYTPDGQLLASASADDETIRFWRVADGQLLHVLNTTNRPKRILFSPSGRYLACDSLDQVDLWDMNVGKWGSKLKKVTHLRRDNETSPSHSESREESLAWSADEQFLLGTDGTKKLYLWRVAGGQLEQIFKGHTYSVTAVAFHPNSQQIASGSADSSVRIWSLTQSDLQHYCRADSTSILSLAGSPDGRTLASSSQDGTVRLWQLSDERPLAAPPPIKKARLIWIRSNALDHSSGPGTTKVVTTSQKHWLDKQNSEMIAPANEMSLPHLICKDSRASGEVRKLAFASDGETIISVSNTGQLSTWQVANGRLIERHLLRDNYAWERHNINLTCIAISPQSQTLTATTDENKAYVWRIRDGKRRYELRGYTRPITALAYTPDRFLLASTGGEDKTVRFWILDSYDFSQSKRIIRPDAIKSLSFSPSGARLAYGTKSGITLINLDDRQVIQHIEHNYAINHTIAWHPDEQMLLYSASQQIHLWSIAKQSLIKTFKGHADQIKEIACHPNGQTFASAAADHTIRIWSLVDESNESPLLHVCYGHEESVLSLAYSPDGRVLASGSADGTVYLWQLPAG